MSEEKVHVEVRGYRGLEVWKRSRLLVRDIYEISANFPSSEMYGLTSQLRRASVSIVANIVEGNARFSKKEYAHFVSIAHGSAAETCALIELAGDLNYISTDKSEVVVQNVEIISKMLNKLRASLTLN